MRHTSLARAAVVFAAVAMATFGFAPAVSAHVTVSSPSAAQGGYAKVTFRVPNEQADASTVKLEVTLPTDASIVSVSVKPVAGWSAASEKTKLTTPVKTDDGEVTEAVSKIVWSAVGDAAIKPGQFQEFDLSLGPLPKTDQVVFKALQTYSDGEVVRWIDEPTGGTDPDHPAPVLKLAKAAGDEHAHGALATDRDTTVGDAAATVTTGGTSRDGVAIGIGLAGFVVGAAGLALAVLAVRRSPTRSSP